MPSELSTERIEEIPADVYYGGPRGIDGRGLRVPSDLDESLWLYQQLPRDRQEEFDRAAYWFDLASRHQTSSLSASFAALVSTIEALVNEKDNRTEQFKRFLGKYAPGASLESPRGEMYQLRSDILHGSELMEIDQDEYLAGWDPPQFRDGHLYGELWGLTRTAMRNWLKKPPMRNPRSLGLRRHRRG